MARVCEICGNCPVAGHNVSHANNKRNRRWYPDLPRVRALVDVEPGHRRIFTIAAQVAVDAPLSGLVLIAPPIGLAQVPPLADLPDSLPVLLGGNRAQQRPVGREHERVLTDRRRAKRREIARRAECEHSGAAADGNPGANDRERREHDEQVATATP